MGNILLFVVIGIPLTVAYLFYRLAMLGGGAKALAVLLTLALGGFTAFLGYDIGFMGVEEVKGSELVTTTWPVLGVIWIVVGAGIAVFGSLVCASATRSGD